MILSELSIQNFRCFQNLPNTPMHELTVFIGANDAGKTAILDAIQCLVGERRPVTDDFHHKHDNGSKEIVISGKFRLIDTDSVPDIYRVPGATELHLRKTFTSSTAQCEVYATAPNDARLRKFRALKADDQKKALKEAGIPDVGPEPDRIARLEEAIKHGTVATSSQWMAVDPSDLNEHLPRLEVIASKDYNNPDSMVQRVFSNVVKATLYPDDPQTGKPKAIDALGPIEDQMREALRTKIEEMKKTILEQNPKVKAVDIRPSFDWARSVTATNLMLDTGEGHRLVSAFGEGTKKKLWMGLLDWERKSQEISEGTGVLRLYDEPDMNLDYEAERKLFSSILETVYRTGSRTQAVVCTHAPTMVDRAPAHAINLIREGKDGVRSIEYLGGGDESDIRDFLATVGRSTGITNSALFYERSFLVVEGPTEENALPLLYKHIHGRSLIEDGIVLIPLHGSGSWQTVLKILQRNKAAITTMLLDEDCKLPGASGHITVEKLSDLNFPADFAAKQCTYIGSKEFEDAFATNDVVDVLNANWPKDDETAWTGAEIDQHRGIDKKFSEDLLHTVLKTCKKGLRGRVGKPEFGRKLGEHCKTDVQIPQAVRGAFNLARIVSGIEPPTPAPPA